MQAALDLAEFLRLHDCKPALTQVLPDSDLELTSGTVLICGPKSNKRIDELLRTDPWLRFREESDASWVIEELASQQVFVSPMDRPMPQDSDIGYCGRVQASPTGPRVILISGIHAVGSVGVVNYLTQLVNLKTLSRTTGKERFSVLMLTKFTPMPFKINQVELLTAPHKH